MPPGRASVYSSRRSFFTVPQINPKSVDRLVLSPQVPLVAGGAAEAFERDIQQLFRTGRRHLIIDLGGVSIIDSAGIRALVRGHTTAQRLGGSLRLAAIRPAVVASARSVASVVHLRDV